jgi:hypothetical protein
LSEVIVFGGYGTFGRQVVRALVERGVNVVVAGRDRAQAEALARSLQPAQSAMVADLSQPESCLAAVRGKAVAIHCAGPFRNCGHGLLEACLEAGCHYVDIADDRSYARAVRDMSDRFQSRGLAAVYGCSSLPGLSGALALRARAGTQEIPAGARVTLFIGNRNPKGAAAIASLLRVVGCPIEAPQRTLIGFRGPEVVALPAPFGKRKVYPFESPEYDVFPSGLGVRSVRVMVGFELRFATRAIALLAACRSGYGPGTAKLLALLGSLTGWLGCSGGAVMTELFFSGGRTRWAALATPENGQRMAALPAVMVACALLQTPHVRPGASTAYEFLGAETLLRQMAEAGFPLVEGASQR